MKKYKLNTIAVMFVFVAFVGVAKAQANPGRINAQNRSLSTSSSATSTIIKDRVAERRENLRRIAENRIQKIIRRLEATIVREESIMNRIISRIEKVKSAGGNTTNAEKHIEEARGHFAMTKTALTTFKNSTTSAQILAESNISTSTIIKTGLSKLKDMVVNVEKHIRLGHKSLTEALKSLRGMSTANKTATSTQATTTSTTTNQNN